MWCCLCLTILQMKFKLFDSVLNLELTLSFLRVKGLMFKVATFSTIAFIDLSFYLFSCSLLEAFDAHKLLVRTNKVKTAIQVEDKFNQGQDK